LSAVLVENHREHPFDRQIVESKIAARVPRPSCASPVGSKLGVLQPPV